MLNIKHGIIYLCLFTGGQPLCIILHQCFVMIGILNTYIYSVILYMYDINTLYIYICTYNVGHIYIYITPLGCNYYIRGV